MRTFFLIALALIITYSCSTELPAQKWYKGNLHTHSLWSDGDDFPEMIIQWYKDHDYQFVAMSDHNTIASGEYWYKLKEREIKHKTLEKYQQEFGDWVEIKDFPDSTSVRLKTFEEYRSKLEEPGIFKVIRSEEVTSAYQKKPVHINVTNIQHLIEPVEGSSVVDVMQQTLDQVKAQRQETNTPMFAHINHPNFGYGISAEDLKKIDGERFFEVYNGHPAVHNEGDSLHISTEEIWDAVNISYHQQGKPLLLGIATDDSHNYHAKSSDLSNSGRGWVMVASDSIATNSIIDAMEEGNFYASCGISLKTVFHDKKHYFVEIVPETGIGYEIIFYGYKKNSESVVELSRKSGITATYTFANDDIFVRAKIISDQKMPNPYKEGETMKAWTQPVLVH
jgi:hypothetical protein